MQPRTFAIVAALALAIAACASTSPVEQVSPDASLADAEATALPPSPAGTAWRRQVIYLAMVDRIRNGDPTNDNATGCADKTNPKRYHGGDLEGMRQHVPYLEELGVTAVWITPPNLQRGPVACGGYHGYWIDYSDPPDDELQPEIGTHASLVGFAEDLHARGMKLVLDIVVNHAGDRARLADQRPEWFHDPATCGALGTPMVYCPLDHHPDFAQERPEVASYLSAHAARAVARYKLDGIRMDTAKHVPAAYFRDSFLPAVRAEQPGVFVIAEIFEQGSTQPFVPYLEAGFDSAFHFPLYAALRDGVGRSGSIDRVADAIADGIARLGADRALDLVLFVDNHDVPRFANVPGYGVTEDEIRRRLLLAFDLLFTLPGIPQLYYGDELGMYGGGDPDNRRDFPAWASDPVERAKPHPGVAVAGADQVYARIKKLSALRRSVPALADGAYRELWRQNGAANPNVLAFSRGSGAGIRIVVANNGAARSGTMRIPVHGIADGTQLVDELDDGAPAQVTITGGRLVVDLPPRGAAIYRLAN
jgi:glycosidase